MKSEFNENFVCENDDSTDISDEEYHRFLESIFDDLMREVANRYLKEKRKTDPEFEFKELSLEEKVKINEYFRDELKFKKVPLVINELE